MSHGKPGSLQFTPDALTSPEVLALINTHLRLMKSQSPACSVHSPEIDRLRASDMKFWSAWLPAGSAETETTLVGCAALKRLTPEHGELKTFHVRAKFRGRGYAKAMVRNIEIEAQLSGIKRLFLETGTSVEFTTARKLYTACGYAECPPFADYQLDPLSLFMTRNLP